MGELGVYPSVNATLYAPDGSQVFNLNTDSYVDPTTLTQAGRYSLVVDGESASAVNCQFEVDDASTQPLTTNAVTTGTLPSGLARHLYEFNATAGQVLDLNSGQDTPANGSSFTRVAAQ